MEKNLEKQLDETFRIPGVTGVLCTDKNGLCLAAKGTAKKQTSGPISALARQAKDVSSQAGTSPVVCIESETGSVLIKSEDGLTVAVFKAS
ncbi:ragulator complex protein LAMTOR5-like [Gigantopelta aegis]|uniref:ragulator complex protein LAMTOR5-like n=1 Tax=Gigantopelta aegis TaxID=1735272 RepID=UPI001B88E0BF|nr:ragulator complex protein LAMTOR5-like [Gigantopelta aegis]